MKRNSANKQIPRDIDPGQEIWVPKEEIIKKYGVRDRTLTYWRGEEKIRYKTIRNRTYYIEDDVREMVEKQNRPKKYFGIRKTYIIKKLKNLDPVLGAVILGGGYALANGLKSATGPWWTFIIYNFVFCLTLTIGLIYGIVKLIKYCIRRYLKKKNSSK
jgi:hypothetical protein